MADEFGPALRASCAFVSHVMLADRVLPHIEDWLPATRTRKVCRHSDTGTQGMYPAATQSRPKRPNPPWSLLAGASVVPATSRGSRTQTDAFPALALEQFNHANDRRPCARPPPAGDETHKLWLGDPLRSGSPATPANPARLLRRARRLFRSSTNASTRAAASARNSRSCPHPCTPLSACRRAPVSEHARRCAR